MPTTWKYTPEYDRSSLEALTTALDEVSAYRSWRAYDPGPDYPIEERYAAMPALTKRDIRKHFPYGFIPDHKDLQKALSRREIEFVETSGSAGDKVTNIWNQAWWDASEKATWKYNSHAQRIATGEHPEALLVSPLNVGILSDERELSIEERRRGRFLYLNEKSSTMSWTPQHMDRMIEELGIFQPVILEANPSYLARFCRYIAAGDRAVFQPQLIILSYEYPSALHLRHIRRVFSTPVASSYGTTETGCVFMECEEGRFHQNSDYCRVDFQPFKPEHGGPRLGRILVTTFNNPWYYMVRFDVGDLVRLDEQGACPCGRNNSMLLTAVEGRATNVTLTTAGRVVTLRELDLSVTRLEGIDEYRLEQAAENDYQLTIVSQCRKTDVLLKQATDVLKDLYGQDARITINFTDAIAPEQSGKYVLARPLFPVDIVKYLDAGVPSDKDGER